ncbi:MAG: FAD-binding oxidoreductase [Pseudomonadota bacterium]
MGIPKEAYKALEDIVGMEYITEDPAIARAYIGRLGHGKDTGIDLTMNMAPACVVLPRTTKEVQAIIKVANRYNITYVPASTFWISHCGAKRPNSILIDLKRMNDLEIDDKNMYAVVGSGVIYSQLQQEAMNRGLYTTVPGGGAQVSVVANHITWGLSPLNYRNGVCSRRVMAAEWVLPDGEIVKLGSLSLQDDPFWGEGPGPDLRGVIRGWVGWFGGLGVVTKMAVKLFPFQPERLEPVGISPNTTLEFPTSRMKWFNFRLPSRQSLVEVMYEIGKAEIAAAVTKVPLLWRYIAKARSKENFWEMFDTQKAREEQDNMHICRVLLVGYTSEEQLEYEEKVLMEIMEEYGGELGRTRQSDESWIKNADSAGMWFMTGAYSSTQVTVETLDCAAKGGEALAQSKLNYTPPLMDDYGEPGWFQLTELGHMGYLEFLNYWDPDGPDLDKKDEWIYITMAKEDIRLGLFNAFNIYASPMNLSGKAYGPNAHLWFEKVKKAFDPAGLSNTPVPWDVDEWVEKVNYPKKDW